MSADQTQRSSTNQHVRVVVSDVDIGFWRAVKIFLKLGLAMIPAVIMLALLNGFAAGFVKAKVR
jgi:hypothetical protein